VDALSHLWLVVISAFSCDDWLVFTCSWAVHVRSAWALCFAPRGSPVTLFHTQQSFTSRSRPFTCLTNYPKRGHASEERERNVPSSFVSRHQHKPTSSLSLSLLTWYETLHWRIIMKISVIHENTFFFKYN